MRRILVVVFCIFCAACSSRADFGGQYIYHDDGTAKPKIAIIPVLDKSGSDLPWNLSDELTEMVEAKIDQSGQFFLTQDFVALGGALLKQPDLNPFLEEIDWVKESNSSTEFIVFVELVEHKLTPKTQSKSFFLQSYILDIALRVRVLDIRDRSTKVILQEITQESFHIPWRFTSVDYKKSGWSKAAFHLSPMGSAHAQMIKRITKQIQDYILIAKTN